MKSLRRSSCTQGLTAILLTIVYSLTVSAAHGDLSLNYGLGGMDLTAPPAQTDGKIAFTSNRDGNQEIYVMNPDGTDQVRLTNNTIIDDHPTWSPNGQSIAFLGERVGGGFAIYVMKADGSGKTEITPVNYPPAGTWNGWDAWSMSWSPDGRQIVFSEGVFLQFRSLVVVNSDGTQRRTLQTGFNPAWSPDGSKIMFLRVGVPNPYVHNDIFTVRPDGTDLIEITPTLRDFFVVWYHPPIWSPNGSKIAFGSTDSANHEINIANANGSNTQYFEGGCALLVPEGCSSTSLPAWSPDGRTIAFVNWGQSSGTEIYSKNIGASEVIRLTDTPGVNSNPSWQPTRARVILSAGE